MRWPLSRPWTLVWFWILLFGTPGLRTHWPMITEEMLLSIRGIGALLLSLAVVNTSVSRLARTEHSHRDLLAVFGSLAFYCAVLGVLAWTASTRNDVASRAGNDPMWSPGRLDLAYDIPNPERARLFASVLYGELGLRICYRQAESPSCFEPNREEREHRREKLDLQRDGLRAQQKLRDQARRTQLTLYAHLFALPGVSAVYLIWFKRRRARA